MNKEELTDYRRRLLLEYRDTILKRERLDVYLINNREKTGTENELKNRELMTKQLEVLNEYEELLFCRLMIELTTD